MELKFRIFWTHPESDCNGFDYFSVFDGYKAKDLCQEFEEVNQFKGAVK